MCIIIVKPAGADIPPSTLLRAYQRNDDGWGLVALTPRGLIVRRDYGRTADQTLLDAFEELRDHTLIVHCRIGTSGTLGLTNTHPFEIEAGVWLFHNGTLDIDRSANPDLCDSFHAAKAIGEALHGYDVRAVIRDEEYRKALEKWIDTSRMVLVDESGYVIVNEQHGFWEDGCWFSNETIRQDYEPLYIGGPRDALYDEAATEIETFYGRYYDGITPRCYRVETQEDEDHLYVQTMAFIEDMKKLDIDDIAQYCADEPEMAAEALYLLVNSRSLIAQ